MIITNTYLKSITLAITLTNLLHSQVGEYFAKYQNVMLVLAIGNLSELFSAESIQEVTVNFGSTAQTARLLKEWLQNLLLEEEPAQKVSPPFLALSCYSSSLSRVVTYLAYSKALTSTGVCTAEGQ